MGGSPCGPPSQNLAPRGRSCTFPSRPGADHLAGEKRSHGGDDAGLHQISKCAPGPEAIGPGPKARVKSMTGRSRMARLSLRTRVRLHRARLDQELADGRPADTSEARALRASQLARESTRRRLARSLRRVVDDVDKPPAPMCARVPVRRQAIRSWGEGLLGLAERLERPGPVHACGVARATLLVTDGAGPIYHSQASQSIAEAVWSIADGLQPCPPHAWGSPVIMKLDPEHVAWTCSRCGAIALTDDQAVRPA